MQYFAESAFSTKKLYFVYFQCIAVFFVFSALSPVKTNSNTFL